MSLKPFIVIVMLMFAGCGQSSSSHVTEEYKSVEPDQLVAVLKEIEKSGEFSAVLPGLSAGLEQAGFMNEAARIQSFTEMPAEGVKKLAKAIAKEVEKAQKSGDSK
ncbi:hypothetical protein [Planctomicrobium sp. SH527]|uniref:hypothetical protein n=1 Tax=Planctomicrobium sp. SH527 TaxID=3448123 RepID=UPI003F5B6168